MSEMIIPLSQAGSMPVLVKYVLKDKCDAAPDKEEIAAYGKAMQDMGYQDVLDVKKKDPRWFPMYKQHTTKVIVIDDKDLPACPAAPKEEKPAETSEKPAEPVEMPEKPVEDTTAKPPDKITETKDVPKKKKGGKKTEGKKSETCPFGQTYDKKAGTCI